MKKKKWCQLSKEEVEALDPDEEGRSCDDCHCFDCYGDSAY